MADLSKNELIQKEVDNGKSREDTEASSGQKTTKRSKTATAPADTPDAKNKAALDKRQRARAKVGKNEKTIYFSVPAHVLPEEGSFTTLRAGTEWSKVEPGDVLTARVSENGFNHPPQFGINAPGPDTFLGDFVVEAVDVHESFRQAITSKAVSHGEAYIRQGRPVARLEELIKAHYDQDALRGMDGHTVLTLHRVFEE